MPDIRQHADQLLQLITEALPMETGGDDGPLVWDEGNQCALTFDETLGVILTLDEVVDAIFLSWVLGDLPEDEAFGQFLGNEFHGVSHPDRPLGEDFAEDAQPGHDAVAGDLVDGAPGVALLPDLGHFKCMGQTGAVVIALVVDENLGFVFQPAKSAGVQDAVSVALETGAIFRFIFRVFTPF